MPEESNRQGIAQLMPGTVTVFFHVGGTAIETKGVLDSGFGFPLAIPETLYAQLGRPPIVGVVAVQDASSGVTKVSVCRVTFTIHNKTFSDFAILQSRF